MINLSFSKNFYYTYLIINYNESIDCILLLEPTTLADKIIDFVNNSNCITKETVKLILENIINEFNLYVTKKVAKFHKNYKTDRKVLYINSLDDLEYKLNYNTIILHFLNDILVKLKLKMYYL